MTSATSWWWEHRPRGSHPVGAGWGGCPLLGAKPGEGDKGGYVEDPFEENGLTDWSHILNQVIGRVDVYGSGL